MTRLTAMVLDGPCFGSYDVRRVTERMVFTVDSRDGKTYALDEPEDVIEPTEIAYVYEVDGGIGWVCGRGTTTRTVSLRFAGRLDAGTGEFLPAEPDELERIRRDGRKRLVAMAWPKRDDSDRTVGERPASAEPQGALF